MASRSRAICLSATTNRRDERTRVGRARRRAKEDTLTVKEWKEGEAPNVVLSEAVPMWPRESNGADPLRGWGASPT